MTGFERFVTDAVDATRREFRVGRALRGTGLGLGGSVVDRLRRNADTLEKRVVEPELRTYRQQSIEQFDVVLDYVEGEDPIEAYRSRLIAADGYLDSIDPAAPETTREAVADEVVARLERLGDAVEPIAAHPADEFWVPVREQFDRESATALVEEAFPFTGPLRRHRDAFAFTVEIDPGDVLGGLARGLPSVSIEYTDEAIRAMRRAERRVVRETKSEVADRFDG